MNLPIYTNQIGGIVGDTVGDLAGRILTGTIGVVVVLIVAGVILGFFFWVRDRRKYNILVEIQSARSEGVTPQDVVQLSDKDYLGYVNRALQEGNFKLIYDKAALKYDKTDKSWYFRILGEKVALTVPPFKVLQQSNKGNVLKIWQKSNIEYFFLLPGKINKEFIVRADGQMYKVAEIEQYQLEGDDPAWIMERQRRNRNWFVMDSILSRLLMYLPVMIMTVIFVFLIWIVLGKLPPLIESLNALAQSMSDLNQAQFVQSG